jgi:histone H3/H4
MLKFSMARIEKIIHDAGGQRASNGAIKALDELLAARGTEIAKQALELARRQGDKTIRESDIARVL